jgi:N-acetylmuramoyl-L-alanine amidase
LVSEATPPQLQPPAQLPPAPKLPVTVDATVPVLPVAPPVLPPAPARPVTPAIVAPAPARSAEVAKSARLTTGGESSMVRALGLKINRVVIDPGHGGHDEGTSGPKGLLEKDLVLDVAQRLGKLIEQRMGSEVIYTRSDDTFVPLEGRTELANEKKADLFLSIHANSSPAAPRVTGIETYYLNFTQSKDSLEVAARENATSDKTVFDLRDLIQKITLQEKAEESREFAERIQASLYSLSARNFPGEKNRGVRKAPFVVLIGANMPSVLVEIGFLTNPKEESLLRKPDYRQKVAEALYRGIGRYSDGLSHFQVAKN